MSVLHKSPGSSLLLLHNDGNIRQEDTWTPSDVTCETVKRGENASNNYRTQVVAAHM